MFEVDSWEGNTEQEDKLVLDLFGGHQDKSSTLKKKRKRKNKEVELPDGKREEIGVVVQAKTIAIAEEGYMMEKLENGHAKGKQEKINISTTMPENNESPKPCDTSKPKKKKNKVKNSEENKNGNKIELSAADEMGSGKHGKKKKKKKKHPCDAVTVDMANNSAESLSKTAGLCVEVKNQDKFNLISSLDSDKLMCTKNDTEKYQITAASPKTSDLQNKLKKKLESSRFRWINEQLYSIPGDEALKLFKEDQAMFDVYHQGFRRQVEQWPVNPVDVIINWVKQRPSSLVLADFGCGDAAIAQSVPNKVFSFDLVAKNEWVTACNMAKVPLNPNSVDVAIFSLSLMGTELEAFLKEAHRVLKPGGVLKIAEVISRIEVNTFIPALCGLGFKLDSMDDSNKMFIILDLLKDHQNKRRKGKQDLSGLYLKPCIYKRR